MSTHLLFRAGGVLWGMINCQWDIRVSPSLYLFAMGFRFLTVLFAATHIGYCISSPDALGTDITILINNDILGPESPSADSSILLLSNQSRESAAASCAALGETLWAPELNTSSIQSNLDYLAYEGKYSADQLYWIAPRNSTRAISGKGVVAAVSDHLHLPVLCTQTAPFSNSTYQNTQRRITVHSNNEYITGFRDRLSFRFLGIRYALQPKRFAYSELYEGSGGNVTATSYGSQCVQGGGGSEDCLFLNIWSPYLPAHGGATSTKDLKPVLFWIHGGAFTGGTGNDPTFDGGNMASRGDVVMVAINYRLGAFGFLALNDGVTKGNFGIADQINALNWVRKNIQDFGGDPSRITIFGQSAGAASVRALLASPKSGDFSGAIPMSNLGGGGYGTTYSSWLTVEESMKIAGNGLLSSTNCSNVECLRGLGASTISSAGGNVRYLVVDGTYLTTPELVLNGTKLKNVHLMEGLMRDDGAAIVSLINTTSLSQSLISNGFNGSLNLPVPHGSNATLNVWNVTARVATDSIFRCIDQATAYASTVHGAFAPDQYFYEFNRSYQTPGFDPNKPVCDAPVTTGYPYGNPNMEYWKCHSGELYFTFGSLGFNGLPLRDEYDLAFSQAILDSWASFARTYNPNPDHGFLIAREYTNTIRYLEAGEWEPVTLDGLPMRELQWPSRQVEWRDVDVCKELGWPINLYS